MSDRLQWEQLLCSKRRKDTHDKPESMGTGIERAEIERDYDRILFAAPTRRLADFDASIPDGGTRFCSYTSDSFP